MCQSRLPLFRVRRRRQQSCLCRRRNVRWQSWFHLLGLSHRVGRQWPGWGVHRHRWMCLKPVLQVRKQRCGVFRQRELPCCEARACSPRRCRASSSGCAFLWCVCVSWALSAFPCRVRRPKTSISAHPFIPTAGSSNGFYMWPLSPGLPRRRTILLHSERLRPEHTGTLPGL